MSIYSILRRSTKTKKIRFIIQSIFFVISILIFFSVISEEKIVQIYNAFYIFPTLSSLFWQTIPEFIAVTLLVIVIPMFVGRVYCSYFCPVGFVQDIAKRVSDFFKIKKTVSNNNYTLRIFILFLCLFLLVKQSFYYGYLDHFSNFGRVLGLFYTPSLSALIPGIIFLLIITLLPVFYPRWFCRNLCPSGALFEIFGKRALFSISNSKKCNACSVCESICPTLCIKEGDIEYDMCINCFECIEICPKKALQFSFANKKNSLEEVPATPESRRKFLYQGLFSIMGVGAGYSIKENAAAQKKDYSKTIIPPGSGSTSAFLSKCSMCHLCVSVCPTKVLKPSGITSGASIYLKPNMDFNSSYCSYECNTCLSVCPTQAISYFPLDQKKQIKIGSAKLNKETCIPYVKKKDCAACAEHCPTAAVVMERQGDINRPVTKDELCIGCGACQHACPVEPERAIIVAPLLVHTVADNPKPTDREDKIRQPESSDFPF